MRAFVFLNSKILKIIPSKFRLQEHKTGSQIRIERKFQPQFENKNHKVLPDLFFYAIYIMLKMFFFVHSSMSSLKTKFTGFSFSSMCTGCCSIKLEIFGDFMFEITLFL